MTLTNAAVAEALDGLPAYKMHCSFWRRRPSRPPWPTTTAARAGRCQALRLP